MYEVVALICIVVFFQIVMYKIGCMHGEKTYIDIIGSAIIVIELYVLFSMWRK